MKSQERDDFAQKAERFYDEHLRAMLESTRLVAAPHTFAAWIDTGFT